MLENTAQVLASRVHITCLRLPFLTCGARLQSFALLSRTAERTSGTAMDLAVYFGFCVAWDVTTGGFFVSRRSPVLCRERVLVALFQQLAAWVSNRDLRPTLLASSPAVFDLCCFLRALWPLVGNSSRDALVSEGGE